MTAAARSVRVEAQGNGRVAVTGALTFLTARHACEAGIATFTGAGSDVVVDCSGVSESDSAGLAVLIEWRRWARGQGRNLSFANLPAAILSLASLSSLGGVLEDAPA